MCDSLIADLAAWERGRGHTHATVSARVTTLRRFERDACCLLVADTPAVEHFVAGYSPRYRNWLLAMLAGFYSFALRRGHAHHDPTVEVDRSRVPRALPRPCHPADLAVALETASLRLRVCLLLAAFAGLRCVEIARLSWEDVTLGASLFVSGKGGHQRMVPMHPEIELVLGAWGPRRSGPVVPSRRGGGHLSAERVSDLVNTHLRGLGIDATAHQLRHFFGTESYRASRDIKLVQALMGHVSSATTDGYTRVVVDGRAAEAVAAIGLTA